MKKAKQRDKTLSLNVILGAVPFMAGFPVPLQLCRKSSLNPKDAKKTHLATCVLPKTTWQSAQNTAKKMITTNISAVLT